VADLPSVRPPDVRSRPGVLSELGELIILQMLNWRWTWRSFVVLGTALPVLYGLLLGTAVRHSAPGAVGRALIGAVVLAASVDTMGKTAVHFVNLRLNGGLDHLMRLPVRPALLVFATGTAFCAFALPGILVTIVLDGALLRVHLAVSPLVVLVLPLAVLAYVGVGAVIGGLAPTPELANPITMIITNVSLGAGAIVLPAADLPHLVVAVGRINPATYIAAALRAVFLPDSWAGVAGGVAVTAVFAAVAIIAAGRLVSRWTG
jgi:ABC-2 type transport system permease protein